MHADPKRIVLYSDDDIYIKRSTLVGEPVKNKHTAEHYWEQNKGSLKTFGKCPLLLIRSELS